ncbi:transposase [Chryseobacterium daecheongense]|uniref:transposase n=1 Tax=Chryseobacterium daecheongense TaxID=192389 RepID=UPI001FD6EF3E|nr:transposase [Chryseobacterium daecheongense]UOU97079.1 transposase [Chryseobacterium daecheongense]
MDFKEIHMGKMIKKRVTECEIDTPRICNFFKCSVEKIEKMYEEKGLDSEILLKWCKVLGYDFFRIYSQHLILYSPPFKIEAKKKTNKSLLPKFRKNIYTKEIIDFIFEQIDSGKMTKNEVIKRYRIPKTTLYKWISKYKK